MKISYLKHLAIPLLILIGLFLLLDYTGLDLWFSDLFYVPSQGGWKYKHSWWAELVIHRGGRYMIVSIAVVCVILIIESYSEGSIFIQYRRAALYLMLCIGLSTGIVAFGKMSINRHCPWDYSRYGGSVAYTTFFTPSAANAPRGHGFPAGHASGGFSLVALYFIFNDYNPRWAKASIILALGVGSLFTFGQLVRGAHFISHSICSLMICWLTSLVLYRSVFNCTLVPCHSKSRKPCHDR